MIDRIKQKQVLNKHLVSIFDSLLLLNKTEESIDVIPPRVIEGRKMLGVAYTRVGDVARAFDLAEYKNRFHSIKVIENDVIAIDIRLGMDSDLDDELVLGVVDEFQGQKY